MRNYRYFLAALAICAVTAGLSQAALVKPQDATARALDAAMSATGAVTREITVNAWQKLPGSGFSDEQLAELAKEAMRRLNIGPGQYEIKHLGGERHRLVRAEMSGDRFRAVVAVQSLYSTDDSKVPETYLVVNLETTADKGPAGYWVKLAGDAADRGDGTARITTCLIGWLNGKLETDEWVTRLHKAGKVVNISITDTLVQSNFASIVGFSPTLPESISLGDKQVNVNMVMRYNQPEDRTYVIIGSPVITGEY